MVNRRSDQRIGIYSGTFNPVHAGHMAFALQAMQAAKLDKVYFLPERRPRHKKHVEHFAHRLAMLKQASKPYPNIDVLEFDDVSFTVRRTLPNLELLFPDNQLVFLVGSDAALHITEWPLINRLFLSAEIVIGLRSGETSEHMKEVVDGWRKPPVVTLIESYAPDVSSTSVRAALETRQSIKGLLKSVEKYSNHHWLYVSLAESAAQKPTDGLKDQSDQANRTNNS